MAKMSIVINRPKKCIFPHQWTKKNFFTLASAKKFLSLKCAYHKLSDTN